MGINNFDVLKQMSAQNKDIRLFPSVLSARMNGDKSKVEIGVNAQTAFDLLLDGKVGVALLVWDAEQFRAIKAQMEAAQPPRKPMEWLDAHPDDEPEYDGSYIARSGADEA